MNTNSNTYIFIYASVMVIIIAAVLSTDATLLKDKQLQNVKNEKMQAILASANIESMLLKKQISESTYTILTKLNFSRQNFMMNGVSKKIYSMGLIKNFFLLNS